MDQNGDNTGQDSLGANVEEDHKENQECEQKTALFSSTLGSQALQHFTADAEDDAMLALGDVMPSSALMLKLMQRNLRNDMKMSWGSRKKP